MDGGRRSRSRRTVHVCVHITDVTDGEVLDGLMHVAGQLPDGVEPFETRVRLEIRQWLPQHLTGSAEQGWLEALTKLDTTLTGTQVSPSSVEVR